MRPPKKSNQMTLDLWGTSYILVAVFLLIILLVVLKAVFLLPKNSKKFTESKYTYNAIQLLGSREFQTECFDVILSDRSLFAVIAGGNADTKLGRNIATLIVETLKNEYRHESYNTANMEEFFRKSIKKAHKTISDNVYEHNTPPSILIVIIENGFLNIAEMHGSLRGNSVHVHRDKHLIEITNRKTISSIQVSRLKLTGDEIIMMASKGATSSLTETNIISCLSGSTHPRWKNKKIEDSIKRKYLKNQDNVTVIIMERMS